MYGKFSFLPPQCGRFLGPCQTSFDNLNLPAPCPYQFHTNGKVLAMGVSELDA